jgi:N-acetylglucosamine-6-sulfatase
MHMAHHQNPAHYGIRTLRYKLIFFYGLPLDAKGAEPYVTPPGWELYDLEKDPFEVRNLYEDPAYASIVGELTQLLLETKEEIGDSDEIYPDLRKLFEETTRHL